MGKPFSSTEFMENPNARGGDGTGGFEGLEDWVSHLNLGAAGKSGKQVLQQLMSGDFTGLAGSLLSPIHDRFATNQREAERNALMGANAMYAGDQPALMAGLQDTMRNKMAESEGLAYGQAIPSLWSTAGGMFQNAFDARENRELAGLEAATRARLGSGSFANKPGWFDRLGQVAGTASQIAGMAMGIPALGGAGGSSLPMTGPTSANIGDYASMVPSTQYSNMAPNYAGMGYNPADYMPPPLSGIQVPAPGGYGPQP